MKKIITIVALMMLSGCFKNSYSTVNFPETPPELSDCKFFNMSNKDGEYITVARCPNSTTSTISGGKHKKKVVVIDGVEYEAKEKVEEVENLIPN